MSNPPPLPPKPPRLRTDAELSTRDAVLSARRHAIGAENNTIAILSRLGVTTDSMPPMRAAHPTHPDAGPDDSQQLMIALAQGVMNKDKLAQNDKQADRRFQVLIVVLTAVALFAVRLVEVALRGHW